MASTLQYKFSKSELRAISNPKQLLIEAVTLAASHSPDLGQQLLEQQQRNAHLEQQLQKLNQRLQHSQRRCERQQEQLTSAEQRYQSLKEQFQTQRRTGARQPQVPKQQAKQQSTDAATDLGKRENLGKREICLPLGIGVPAQNLVAQPATVPEPLSNSTDAEPTYRKLATPVDLPRFSGVSAS